MDLGHKFSGANGSINFVGDAGYPRVESHARLDWLWIAVGRRADGKRVHTRAGSVSSIVACAGSAQEGLELDSAPCANADHDGNCVRAVGHEKLCGVPQSDPVPLQFWVGIVAGK